jgi:hypothetical protein
LVGPARMTDVVPHRVHFPWRPANASGTWNVRLHDGQVKSITGDNVREARRPRKGTTRAVRHDPPGHVPHQLRALRGHVRILPGGPAVDHDGMPR